MKFLLLLLPILVSCLPESPKDARKPQAPPVLDPLWVEAWHIQSTGQKSFSDGHSVKGEDHKIIGAHQLGFTGKGIRIAVSDDALEVDHPDLEQNQLVGEHRDYTSNHANYEGIPTPISEDDAHGTAVTGLIAAVKGNTIGSFGVAPDALFAGFNFLSADTTQLHIKLHQLQGDFKIFNYSYSLRGFFVSSPVHEDIEAALKLGVDEGSIYVKAAGNSFVDASTGYHVWGNTNFEAEQTLPYYILVGAINSRGKKSSYSTPGSGLWISGAGGEFGTSAPAMITTDLTSCSSGYANKTSGKTSFDKGSNELNSHCDYTNSMNGTSSATPVISGITALMLEARPNLTWRDVKHILAKTADRVDYSLTENTLYHPHTSFVLPAHTYDVKWTKNGANNYFSNWYGFGRANALKAVLMAITYDFPLGTYIEGSYEPSLPIDTVIPYGAVGLSDTINVTSLVTKIESVQVKVVVEHPFIGDLGIELTSPSNVTSRLFLVNSRAFDFEHDPDVSSERTIELLTNAFYEEAASGNWTIKVIDGSSDNDGELKSWSIKINGH